MNPMIAVVAIVVAYFCGTLPSAILIAKSKGVDITTVGSGNPGASNVARALGTKYGVLVFVFDTLKGILPVAATLTDRHIAYACAAAAVLGHVYPVTRKFKGGKGAATGAGSLFPLHPLFMFGALLCWVFIAKTTKKASVASISLVPIIVLTLVVSGTPTWEIFATIGIGALVEIRHVSNIKRLITGTEPPISGTPIH